MSMPEIAFDHSPGEYRPGACNIGPAEIARRRRTGYLGLAAAALLAVFLVAVDASGTARLLVGIPLAGGAMGFLQARFRFCAGFGMAGVRNFGAVGSVERVEEAAARHADRMKAYRISLAAAAIGGVGAIAFAALPI
jgi:hypothetical protein